MLTDRHSILNFREGVTNVNGGHLVAYDNSTIYIGGSAIGGHVDLFSHAAVELNGGASTMNVRFLGGVDEQLTLGQSASYHGSLSILTGRGDTADLFDIRFSPSHNSYNPTTRTLNVSDGTHTAEIKITGTTHYIGNNFSFSTDHHGRTLVGFV